MVAKLVRSAARDLEAVLFEAAPRLIDRAVRLTPEASVQRWVSTQGVSPRFLRVLTSPYVVHPIISGVLSGESDEELHRRALKLERYRRRRYRSESTRVARFRAVQRLIDSIGRDGFRPPAKTSANPDVIGVVVRDDGRLTWIRQGDHRLSLALALGLPSCIIRIRAFEPNFVMRALRDHPHDNVHGSVLAALEGQGIRRFSG